MQNPHVERPSTYNTTDCYHHGSEVISGIAVETNPTAALLRLSHNHAGLQTFAAASYKKREKYPEPITQVLQGHSAAAKSRARCGTHVESGVAPPSDAESIAL
jgi:hypothetical protein